MSIHESLTIQISWPFGKICRRRGKPPPPPFNFKMAAFLPGKSQHLYMPKEHKFLTWRSVLGPLIMAKWFVKTSVGHFKVSRLIKSAFILLLLHCSVPTRFRFFFFFFAIAETNPKSSKHATSGGARNFSRLAQIFRRFGTRDASSDVAFSVQRRVQAGKIATRVQPRPSSIHALESECS